MPSILSMLPSGEIHCALQEHDNDLLNAGYIQICFRKLCFPLLGQNCYFDNDLQFEVISIVLVTNDFEHVIIRRKLKPYKEVNIIPIYYEQMYLVSRSKYLCI